MKIFKHNGHKENLGKGYSLIIRPTLVLFVSLVVKTGIA
jgi:hypothetical protein